MLKIMLKSMLKSMLKKLVSSKCRSFPAVILGISLNAWKWVEPVDCGGVPLSYAAKIFVNLQLQKDKKTPHCWQQHGVDLHINKT